MVQPSKGKNSKMKNLKDKVAGRSFVKLTLALVVTVIFITTGLFQPLHSFAQDQQAVRDGQHDFDFDIGTWKSQMRQLLHPLTGSNDWVDITGTVHVRKVWDGRAALEEIEADGPAGHFEGLTLFLYHPQAHQWAQYFVVGGVGAMNQPLIGGFRNGRGEFFDQETFNGRTILVRFVWSDITPDSHRIEQSYSDDGGKTWEPNFVATLTRTKE
jgi:hypothetical protein